MWGNPFDLRVSKMLHLKFKDNIEIMIYLKAQLESNKYFPEYFFSNKSQRKPAWGSRCPLFYLYVENA
jgi:hypothetical protein